MKGNILDAETDIIAHQVNCYGVMGAGLAKQVREKHPEVYFQYKNACTCRVNELLGNSLVCETMYDKYMVANIFAQKGFGRGLQTDYTALANALVKLRDWMIQHQLKSIAIPYKMGCGLGGGDWGVVSDIIQKVFNDTLIRVEVWEYRR